MLKSAQGPGEASDAHGDGGQLSMTESGGEAVSKPNSGSRSGSEERDQVGQGTGAPKQAREVGKTTSTFTLASVAWR